MRIASKMKLRKGFEAEYKKRHDEIWPELKVLLKETGIFERMNGTIQKPNIFPKNI